VSLGHIQTPFSLTLRTVNDAIYSVTDALGPTEDDEPERARREGLNAKRRIEKLQVFLNNRVTEFKGDENTPARIRDMGTLMHLVLNKEISRLTEQSRNAR
jgi:hypothetical protein